MQVAFGGSTPWLQCKEKLHFQHVLLWMKTSSKVSEEDGWNILTLQRYPSEKLSNRINMQINQIANYYLLSVPREVPWKSNNISFLSSVKWRKLFFPNMKKHYMSVQINSIQKDKQHSNLISIGIGITWFYYSIAYNFKLFCE